MMIANSRLNNEDKCQLYSYKTTSPIQALLCVL